jgi:4-amino-4-deoxy-L-arabinose transferase-like glycosyltransferase
MNSRGSASIIDYRRADTAIPPIRPWVSKFVAVGLLIFGVELWLTLMHGRYGRFYEPPVLLGALLVSLIWPLSKRIDAGVTHCDAWLGQRNGRMALVIGVGMFFFLLWQPADPMEPQLFLRFHDEHSYMIQSQMLARGRLWMPAYPPQIAPFFDNFYLLVDRVYASVYFPGTALLMVPGIWLNLPYWAMPTLAASLAAAIFYLIMQDIFGGVRAILACLMLASLFYFHHAAQMVMSEIPFLLGATILVWSWLKWRRNQDWRWLVLIGAAAGYIGITRPLDALCYALPIGIAILTEMRRPKLPRLPRIAGAILIGASPFLALQIIQNVGVSGSWRVFPTDYYYVVENHLAPPLGFYTIDPQKIPPLACLPKQKAMKDWYIYAFTHHRISDVVTQWIPLPENKWQPERLYGVLLATLPNAMMLMVIPCAVLSLGEIRRRVMVSTVLLFVLGYSAYVFFLAHYMTAVMPGMICLILLGFESLARVWPRARPMIVTFMLLSLGGLTIGAMPELDHFDDPMLNFVETLAANMELSQLSQKPTLVLFRFDPKTSNFQDEPAYNDDVAFPDEAMIVRARDLGLEEDKKLFQYYARLGQDRVVYLYDRGAFSTGHTPMSYLGTIDQLAGGR